MSDNASDNELGSLDQGPPAPPERTVSAPYADPALLPEVLPPEPVVDPKTGMVLIPAKRIDGSVLDAPWILSEGTAWNWLRSAALETIDESVLDGIGGSFYATARASDGELKTLILRFDSVGFEQAYMTWWRDYSLSVDTHDILRHEQAAYEVAKGLGCEDLVPPMAVRTTNLVPLLSDAAREKVAAHYSSDPLLVDEAYGVIGMTQLTPLNGRNFADYWAALGPDNRNRFEQASEAVRFGLYRLIALDFLLGTGTRLLSDLLYNEATGTLAVYGMGITFPDPFEEAKRYVRNRARGWGRAMSAPMQEVTPGCPATNTDTSWLADYFSPRETKECLATFASIVETAEASLPLVIGIALDLGLPVANIAGVVAKLAYLEQNPEAVLAGFWSYTKQILVPLLTGVGPDQAYILDIVNKTMSDSLGEPFDFLSVME